MAAGSDRYVERLVRELKRRTRIVSIFIFLSPDALVRLIDALLIQTSQHFGILFIRARSVLLKDS